MVQFISDNISKFLSSDDHNNAIPVHIVTKERVDDFITDLSAEHSQWAIDNNFKAKKNEILKLADKQGHLTAILVGAGSSCDPMGLSTVAQAAKSLPEGHYTLVDDLISDIERKQISTGWALAQYEFDHYKEKKNKHNAVLIVKEQSLLREISTIINGICLVRDLVNTPACDMGPSHLSKVMEDLAEQYDAVFSAIVGNELLNKNFNTIHTVGRAAANEPRLLDMCWGREDAPRVTLVGKGVCFDSGGLDLKPAAGMRIMKKDMGGAAHALGLAQMIMSCGMDVRLRVLIPAVENNVSANAFRPGDIINSYKGTSIEVGNTDAEGRLVLCDALALASEESPDLLLDFATLTGAARVAMGTDIVPFFTDGDELSNDLLNSSEAVADLIWRLPLYADYEPLLKSGFADLNNMGSTAFGGAITAALFLKHFVAEPSNWVHFDLYAWNQKTKAICPEGGEAMAIRAVFSYLQNRFG